MILLREIQKRDLNALEQLAGIPGLYSLPSDREILLEKINHSIESFKGTLKNKFDSRYLFVAEEIDTERMVGTSMLGAQHGTEESPHFYFEVGTENKFSKTIGTGFIHGTLELKFDTNGPTEIGGLVLAPEYRNSDERIGRQISFVRFLFLGLNRQKFKNKLIAELLPPLNKKGQSPLWEAIGRRFTNMDYWEADHLCEKSKEFIFSLFPTGKIYTTFFSAEARNAIGKIGIQTSPVFHMLTKIGFNYNNNIDPFDGGPHLWADVDQVLPLKNLGTYNYAPHSTFPADLEPQSGLMCKVEQGKGEFRAIAVQAVVHEGTLKLSGIPEQKIHPLLKLSPGDKVAFMPYY